MCGSRTALRLGGPFACIDGWAVASPTDGCALERADDRLWLSWGRSVPVAWHYGLGGAPLVFAFTGVAVAVSAFVEPARDLTFGLPVFAFALCVSGGLRRDGVLAFLLFGRSLG